MAYFVIRVRYRPSDNRPLSDAERENLPIRATLVPGASAADVRAQFTKTPPFGIPLDILDITEFAETSFVSVDVPLSPRESDPKVWNAKSAEWAKLALAVYQHHVGCLGDTVVSDLLSDLMHYCNQYGIDFEQELHEARMHHGAEAGLATPPPSSS